MPDMNLTEFASMLSGMTADYVETQHSQMERAVKVVQVEVKKAIGTYRYGWPQLTARTQQDRSQLGFTPNDPLERTGELENSIETHVELNGIINPHVNGEIGSNLDRAVWQELGTSKIPPRSFLMEGAVHVEKEVVKILGDGAVKPLLNGRGTL